MEDAVEDAADKERRTVGVCLINNKRFYDVRSECARLWKSGQWILAVTQDSAVRTRNMIKKGNNEQTVANMLNDNIWRSSAETAKCVRYGPKT